MNDYILLIALAITFCSLAATLFFFLQWRRAEKNYNINIVKSLHEQDRVTRELERTRIEKQTVERVLKTQLTEMVQNTLAKAREEGHIVGYENHILRIDITYLK